MKRLAYLLTTLIFSLSALVIFSFFATSDIYAQGTCTCLVGETRTCEIQTNNCDEANGYEAFCTTNLNSCDSSPTSCECRRSTLTSPPCGEETEPCCMPGSQCFNPFTCVRGYCVQTCTTRDDCDPGEICTIGVCAPEGTYGAASTIAIFCDTNGNPVTADNPNKTDRLYTAIGCIPVANTQEFVRFLLPWAMGVAGGIAFVLMIYAGFMIMTSAGDPRRLQAGKELLTAAIMGLLLLVLGAYLLRLIGVNILGIF